MLYTKEITFHSDGNKLSGTLYAPSRDSVSPGIIFIYGAGKKANRTRYFLWQEYLMTKGISSFSFDIRGLGESEGRFEDGSLNNRLVDAYNALQAFINTGMVDQTRLAICGNSMGAHIAVRLIEKYSEIKAILLCCAAAYAKEAEDKPLNGEFSEVIRQERSWKNTPVFPILKSYQGKIFVVYGEEEEVIPKEVQDLFVALAKEKGEAHILPHIGHKLLQPKNALEKESFQKLLQLSGKFLQKTL